MALQCSVAADSVATGAAGAVAVPVRVSVGGLVPVDVISRVALRAPAAPGLKASVSVQLAPCVRVPFTAQVPPLTA